MIYKIILRDKETNRQLKKKVYHTQQSYDIYAHKLIERWKLRGIIEEYVLVNDRWYKKDEAPLELKIDDERILLICAFRYALGRRTYIVSDIVDTIKNNWNVLSVHDKKLFIKEILEYKEMYGEIGMDCDEALWMSIVKLGEDL